MVRVLTSFVIAMVALLGDPTGLAVDSVKRVSAAVLSADAMFADTVAKESAVRKALAGGTPAASLVKAIRSVLVGYESLVKHYPGSAHSDDALWRAGQLASDASARLKDVAYRATALRYFRRLTADYPTSPYANRVPSLPLVTASASVGKSPATPPEDTVTPPPPEEPVGTSGPSTQARLLAIHRSVLPDVVRLTFDIDQEVTFRQERLSGPARIYFDLANTGSARSLAERTIRYDHDGDVVRQVRIGQQAGNTTRVVLDAIGVASCHASPLYDPYRLVVDCVREKTSSRALEPIAAPRRGQSFPRPLSDVEGTTKVVAAPPALSARALVPPLTTSLPAGARLTASALASADENRAAAAGSTARTATVPAANLDGRLSIARQLGLTVSRIVIDPGHGGHDPGAKAGDTTEAALVLDIALRLETLLRQEGADVILTRRTDQFVPLEERTSIANREGADLFLSIHTNASATPQAAGVETYFLNFASNGGAASVAARENAASGKPMNALPDVVKAIAMNGKLDESRDLATHVQRALVRQLRPTNRSLKDLGVKQAPFVVLIGATMPSVLAEVSFLTNDQEAKLLKGQNYRQRIAEALLAGLQRYQSSLTRVRERTGQ